jgi:hypothetical protein
MNSDCDRRTEHEHSQSRFRGQCDHAGLCRHHRAVAPGEIEGFWLEGRNRESETWREHRDINMVMLATSLAPDGFLSI